MARDIWTEKEKEYLGLIAREGSTKARIAKNLKTIRRDLCELHATGKVQVDLDGKPYDSRPLNPRPPPPSKVEERHIAALVELWKSRALRKGPKGQKGLARSTWLKYLGDLSGFLAWCSNPVVERMQKTNLLSIPKRGRRRPRVLSAGELSRLRAAAAAMDGWRGAVSRFLVDFLPGCGLRPQELPGQRLEDVDLATGILTVSDPKGGGYEDEDPEAVLSAGARQALVDFLVDRERYLDGEASEWLLPLRKTVPVLDPAGKQARGEDGLPLWVAVVGQWQPATLRKLKSDLQERSGVVFPGLKTFRATYGQDALDKGATIEQVSVAMRHTTTKTTELFYARRKTRPALEAVRAALDGPVVRED